MPFNNTKPNFKLSSNNKSLSLQKPVVMGILNLGEDSFFDGGRYSNVANAVLQIEKMVSEGAAIIDIGAASAKPGSAIVKSELEISRLSIIKEEIQKYPQVFFSVDTYNANTAVYAVDIGFDIINDISSGNIDPKMLETAADLKKPYIAMHMQGTPLHMQDNPQYVHVTKEVLAFFEEKIQTFKHKGIDQLILDLGFGFGKTVKHNYQLLREMDLFESIGYPILAGISRKSMINKVLNISAQQALNGTSALHMMALHHGASILRVHDVKEAIECIKLYEAYLGE
jgi:dihydropteroate synthase